MSKQDRKILIPKRQGKRPFIPRPTQSENLYHETRQGVKRPAEPDSADQAPSKKTSPNFDYNFPVTKYSCNSPTKNIAARRMENLRKSLELHRKSLNNSVDKIKLEQSNSAVNTVPVPVPQCNESMDWAEIDENIIINNINELRKEIKYDLLPTAENLKNACSDTVTKNGVCIVVDTNIFLSQLQFISQLREKLTAGSVMVIVPWMVIQELDYMKESNCSKSLSKAARRAVQFIHTQLSNKNPYFKGQSVLEASKCDLSSKNPDDGILFCCLQLAESQKSVVLLSNDINLRNKSLVSNIPAYSSTDIISKLTAKESKVETVNTSQSVEKIKIILSNLLTHIISNELKHAYGDIWRRMLKTQPPFTIEEALNYFLKYWVAVFSFSLQKQCKLKIEEFVQFLKKHGNDYNYQPENLKTFIEYSLSICIYIKNGLTNYRELIVDCIKGIQSHAE